MSKIGYSQEPDIKAVKEYLYNNVVFYKDKKGGNLQLNFVQTIQLSTALIRRLVGRPRRKPQPELMQEEVLKPRGAQVENLLVLLDKDQYKAYDENRNLQGLGAEDLTIVGVGDGFADYSLGNQSKHLDENRRTKRACNDSEPEEALEAKIHRAL